MEAREMAELEALIEREFDRLYARLEREEQASAARWGGFFRRASALVVDILVLSLFSLLLFYLSLVGYSVGLAAHDRSISWEMKMELVRVVLLAWVCLVGGYFVLLHTLEGRTVGKWLLGLRVVGADQARIGYLRALTRFIVAALSAPLVLGFLWILWSREKRAWHDLVARTWVIRE
jgi:uncharacterized RDD family membrane protein YckC